MNKTLFFIVITSVCFLITSESYAQTLKTQTLLDNSGNVYVVGQTKCYQDSDLVIIKYNPVNGAMNWYRKLGLLGNTAFQSAVLSGNYIYISATNFYNGNKRIAAIRCDLLGNISSAYFDRAGGDYGNTIALSGSNIYIAGRTDLPIYQPKFVVIKYNLNLDTSWSYTYNGSLSGIFDEVLVVKSDLAGNVYATGYTSQSQVLSDSYDFLTIKLNSSGVLQWAKKYNGYNKEDRAVGMEIDASSNVYVTGYSYYGTGCDYVIIKYNTNGDSISGATYRCGNNTLNQPKAITSDAAGNIYVTGNGKCDGKNHYDFVTIKYNSSLIPQWPSPRVYIGSLNSVPLSIAFSNSKIYVSGYSDSINNFRKQLTIAYDANSGAELWKWFMNTSDSNYSTSVIADINDNVYTTGYSVPDTIIIAKYNSWFSKFAFCAPTGLVMISNIIPESYNLYQNYPNPFNPGTVIKFDVRKNSNIRIVVYNAIGTEVDEIVNDQLTPGTYEIDWNGNKFASGVYFCKITTEDFTQTMKMLLLK